METSGEDVWALRVLNENKKAQGVLGFSGRDNLLYFANISVRA